MVENIPKCMSTQHPDNVSPPFFAENAELSGDDEVQEAYYAFSHLGCDEQMWDCEGKEVDNYVVRKLLSKHEDFFREQILGRDVFITLRVPNPSIEKAEAKILLETLESIPRSFDAAKLFYGKDIAPIFEVILPMTESHCCIDRIYKYYQDFVVGKQHHSFGTGDITVADWIGEFKPKKINVIPLFESRDKMLDCHNITREYLKGKNLDYQRVFLARSDPALNYGLVSAVLLNKIALSRLAKLSKELKIPIYPIIGVGSAPFRGNLRPENVDRVASEYPSAHTFTIQSSFKYDNHPEVVHAAILKLKQREPSAAQDINEERCLQIIQKYSEMYKQQIVELAVVINQVAHFIPSRRKRKLHTGLFGYSRDIETIKLPRVISFTAAMYSLGFPPELLGLNALDKDDLKFIRSVYLNFDADIADALKFFNPDCPLVPPELKESISLLGIKFTPDKNHQFVTEQIVNNLNQKSNNLAELVLRAAHLRRFLG